MHSNGICFNVMVVGQGKGRSAAVLMTAADGEWRPDTGMAVALFKLTILDHSMKNI
ncbi:hypothetical protein SESBI_50317 [Sesbania bispinosa]|nr:hypothetical protein SESBI_50317 [Sesbania bispinosa]